MSALGEDPWYKSNTSRTDSTVTFGLGLICIVFGKISSRSTLRTYFDEDKYVFDTTNAAIQALLFCENQQRDNKERERENLIMHTSAKMFLWIVKFLIKNQIESINYPMHKAANVQRCKESLD